MDRTRKLLFWHGCWWRHLYLHTVWHERSEVIPVIHCPQQPPLKVCDNNCKKHNLSVLETTDWLFIWFLFTGDKLKYNYKNIAHSILESLSIKWWNINQVWHTSFILFLYCSTTWSDPKFDTDFFRNSSVSESKMKDLGMTIDGILKFCVFRYTYYPCSELFEIVYTDAGMCINIILSNLR